MTSTRRLARLILDLSEEDLARLPPWQLARMLERLSATRIDSTAAAALERLIGVSLQRARELVRKSLAGIDEVH